MTYQVRVARLQTGDTLRLAPGERIVAVLGSEPSATLSDGAPCHRVTLLVELP